MFGEIHYIGETKGLHQELQSAVAPELTIVRHKFAETAAKSILNSDLDNLPELIVLLEATNIDRTIDDCRTLREQLHNHPIVILALIDNPDLRERCISSGADDCLMLPLIPAQARNRIEAYLCPEMESLDLVNHLEHEMIRETASGVPPKLDLLEELAGIFSATSAWVFTLSHSNELLLARYYSPQSTSTQGMQAQSFPDQWMGLLQQTSSSHPEMITISKEDGEGDPNQAGIQCLVRIPLLNQEIVVGLLVLGYTAPPQRLLAQRRLWSAAGRSLANLLEPEKMRGEEETYSVQTGLLGLSTRIISQAADIQQLISLTLDHTVPMLDAYWGCIWMYSEDREWLELTSSLSHAPIPQQPNRLRRDQGLVGWVGTRGKTLCTEQPSQNPNFDPQVDRVKGSDEFTFLAVPLRYQDEILGVLSLHKEHGDKISDHEVVIIESIANLTASCISNFNLVRELRDHSRQQRALFEMSQQIAQGLDLQTTLKRALQWVIRLIEVEVGILWLVDEGMTALEYVASLGGDLKGQEGTKIPLDQELFGHIVSQGEPALVNDLDHDPRIDRSIRKILGTNSKNLVLLPMIYRGEAIGVLGLVNKVGGRFLPSELDLLTTASGMMAIAVGNARLYSHTIDLLQEREHVHALALQTARFATVGRLTASLSHEINNPMQAIRGALELAMENLEDEETLGEYIAMCLRESERVVHLINRMRHIYRPTSMDPEPIRVNDTINEISIVARKEIARQGISLHLDLASDLQDVTGMVDQLRLVFLSVALSLSDALSKSQGDRKLTIRTSPTHQGVRIEYLADPPISSWAIGFNTRDVQNPTEASVSLLLSKDIISALGGTIQFLEKDQGNIVAIELPAPGTN